MNARFIDKFDVILLDMGQTFMFDVDRFSDEENFGATYRQIGGRAAVVAGNTMERNREQMMHDEWLEADGLGGFASGTVSGIRTRRYHALLLTATKPPAGRLVLINGFDASVKTANGTFALASQLYSPDVIHPDGASCIVEFTHEPWPKWTFALEDTRKLNKNCSPFTVHRWSRSPGGC